MPAALLWTMQRCDLVGKLVRRHVFDFEAASLAFREHLNSEGVEFSPEDTNPTSLRKVFATSDRKSSNNKPLLIASSSVRNGNGSLDGNCTYSKPTSIGEETKDITVSFQPTQNSDLIRSPSPGRKDVKNGETNRAVSPSDILHETPATEREAIWSSENEPAWSFESFLEDQRRKETQHEDQKEKLFQQVLSALGGNGNAKVSSDADIPPDIMNAWSMRNEKLAAAAEIAQNRQLKLEEGRSLALQRELLKQRHFSGADDRVGENLLALPAGDETPTSRGEGGEKPEASSCHLSVREQQGIDPFTHPEATTGPVQLELEMDADVLDRILDEIEESVRAAGGCRQTDSELSRVIDELDKAAGGISATTAPLLSGIQE